MDDLGVAMSEPDAAPIHRAILTAGVRATRVFESLVDRRPLAHDHVLSALRAISIPFDQVRIGRAAMAGMAGELALALARVDELLPSTHRDTLDVVSAFVNASLDVVRGLAHTKHFDVQWAQETTVESLTRVCNALLGQDVEIVGAAHATFPRPRAIRNLAGRGLPLEWWTLTASDANEEAGGPQNRITAELHGWLSEGLRRGSQVWRLAIARPQVQWDEAQRRWFEAQRIFSVLSDPLPGVFRGRASLRNEGHLLVRSSAACVTERAQLLVTVEDTRPGDLCIKEVPVVSSPIEDAEWRGGVDFRRIQSA